MDFAAELDRLEHLYREGALYDREYAAAKAALISRLQAGDVNGQTAPSNQQSAFVFLVAIVLILVGLFMSAGAAMNLLSKDPKVSFQQNLVLGILLGVMPLVIGLVLCFRRR